MGASSGSWFDFRSQPTVLELLLLLRMHGKGDDGACSALISMSTVDPMYSLVFSVKARCSPGVDLYLQPIPVWGQKPPIPISEESENVEMFSFLKMIWLIDMPFLADSRNSSQSARSSRV